jgi:YVTN family beta-propeller protein
VACFNLNVPPGQLGQGKVTPIHTATNTTGKPISFGTNFPNHIAITRNSAIAYVTSGAGVTPIHTATGTAGMTIKAGNGPSAIAITPDGQTAYVANDGTGQSPGRTVTPIDTATGTALKAIQVGLRPVAIAITP